MKKIPSLLAVLTLSLALATRLSAAPGFRPVLQGARISGVSVSARSSDGILLATATGSSIMIWRAADGVLLNSILEHRNEVIGMGFLPGRPVLVSADRGGIVVEYDLAADALVKSSRSSA